MRDFDSPEIASDSLGQALNGLQDCCGALPGDIFGSEVASLDLSSAIDGAIWALVAAGLAVVGKNHDAVKPSPSQSFTILCADDHTLVAFLSAFRVVEKPFTRATLAGAVRAALDRHENPTRPPSPRAI